MSESRCKLALLAGSHQWDAGSQAINVSYVAWLTRPYRDCNSPMVLLEVQQYYKIYKTDRILNALSSYNNNSICYARLAEE